MIIQGCLMAIMWGGGFFTRSASMHESEINDCFSRVNQYVSTHCPIPAVPHKEWEKHLWTAIEAVSNSKAKTDAEALTAACSR
jgi:hypothetical protein